MRRLALEHSQYVLYDNASMSRGFSGLFLLFEVDDVASCEDVGVVSELEGGKGFDMVRSIKHVFAQRLFDEVGIGRGADGWNLRWGMVLLSFVSRWEEGVDALPLGQR
jgi:hypothetical protein